MLRKIMKILAVFFIAAVVGCHGDETCIDEEAESCVVELLSSIVDDTEEYETCKELQKAIDCLENSVQSCAEDELDAEIKKSVEDLKLLRTEECHMYALSSEEHEKMETCFEVNEEYMFECLNVVTSSTKEIFGEDDVENIDENLLQCGMYRFLTKCFVDRLDERCGALAAETAKAEFRQVVPDKITEACGAANLAVDPFDEDGE